VSETLRALRGAWRLAAGDRTALALFDDSVGGFWRSFRAALIIAPAQALLLALKYAGEPPAAGWPRIAAVELIAYAMSWLAFPVAMELVCRLLDRERAWRGYIVVYNWAAVLQIAVFVPAVLLAAALPGALTSLLLLVIWLAVMIYTWLIARIALAVHPLSAAAIVVLDFALTYLIGKAADGLVY
jgi:hypothetical protein